jgi:hypothetical protein
VISGKYLRCRTVRGTRARTRRRRARYLGLKKGTEASRAEAALEEAEAALPGMSWVLASLTSTLTSWPSSGICTRKNPNPDPAGDRSGSGDIGACACAYGCVPLGVEGREREEERERRPVLELGIVHIASGTVPVDRRLPADDALDDGLDRPSGYTTESGIL